jgi:beta-lactamase class A
VNLFFSNRFIIVAVFILGLVSGFYISGFSLLNNGQGIVKDIKPFREKENSYGLINPLLFYETPNSIDSKEFNSLIGVVNKVINEFKKGEGRNLSFYYRDLNDGIWVGINENDKYIPSSLLKVVVMIAYHKEIESQPDILSHRIEFSSELADLIGSIPHDRGTDLKVGKIYSVEDLINKMIIDSDNGATYALISEINDDSLGKIYNDLGLKNPGDAGRAYTISVNDYVPFIRILYNATYLNRDMSERALDLLSKSNFQDGIAAGVPRQFKVAHKYGETVYGSTDNEIDSIELHDCGIVYYPAKPYLLCIMSRGENLEILSQTIKTLSEAVFNFVSSSQ